MFTCKNAAQNVANGIDWEISFFDFTDSFRKESEKEPLIAEQPNTTGHLKYDALLRSMVLYLCDEYNIQPPEWALQNMFLEHPWFVCELSRLYSYSLVETPICFKQNNIFVLSNFMDRV